MNFEFEFGPLGCVRWTKLSRHREYTGTMTSVAWSCGVSVDVQGSSGALSSVYGRTATALANGQTKFLYWFWGVVSLQRHLCPIVLLRMCLCVMFKNLNRVMYVCVFVVLRVELWFLSNFGSDSVSVWVLSPGLGLSTQVFSWCPMLILIYVVRSDHDGGHLCMLGSRGCDFCLILVVTLSVFGCCPLALSFLRKYLGDI